MAKFIDPLTLARVKDLPLVAKTVAQGVLHGSHTSTQRGTGVEFNQYRAYEPGDPLARVDWKLFARSDRYFVREAERESNINIWLVLDASQSMLQISEKSAQQGGWHKLDYARYLLATIGYIAQQQGDGVGLVSLSSDHIDYLPARNGQQHWHKLLLQLSRVQPGQTFPETQRIPGHLTAGQMRGLVFVVSDFHQQKNEIMDFVSSLSAPQTEVVAVQLCCDDELNFPFSGQVSFEDLESGQQRLVAAKQVRAQYLQAYEQFQHTLDQQFQQHRIQSIHTNIDQPLDECLYHYMATRRKVGY
jgi:uncharacterized protein (DUF58 family)